MIVYDLLWYCCHGKHMAECEKEDYHLRTGSNKHIFRGTPLAWRWLNEISRFNSWLGRNTQILSTDPFFNITLLYLSLHLEPIEIGLWNTKFWLKIELVRNCQISIQTSHLECRQSHIWVLGTIFDAGRVCSSSSSETVRFFCLFCCLCCIGGMFSFSSS